MRYGSRHSGHTWVWAPRNATDRNEPARGKVRAGRAKTSLLKPPELSFLLLRMLARFDDPKEEVLNRDRINVTRN